jgi:iron complex outermembrane receptor protein
MHGQMKNFLLILLLFPFSVFAKDLITISNFEPFESEKNQSIEDKILSEIRSELDKENLEVKVLNSNLEDSLKEAQRRGASLHITGYYRKSSKMPLDIYIQVYSIEKGTVIDASNASSDFESGSIDYDPSDIAKLDNSRVTEVVKKLSIQLRLNPNKKVQYQGIQDNLINQPISKKIQFKLPESGKKEITKDAFDIMAGREVETASRSKESIFDAPASILVITEEDIRNRGYTSLTEVLNDIPGFDNISSNGAPGVIPYMRGYRSAEGQRILFMIDSKPQNELWYQQTVISRQYPMTGIKKIEILYGPSSVVYGPNASQGIINIITKNGSELKKDGSNATISLQHGDFNTNAIDANVNGKSGDFSYSGSVRHFKSDEPNLSKRKSDSYLNNFYFSNPSIWGPVLSADNSGKKVGKYYDPSTNTGIMGSVSYKGLKVGIVFTEANEGYGAAYTGDQVQNNAPWVHDAKMYYAEYEKNIANRFRSFTQIYQRDYNIKENWVESIPNPTAEDPSGSLVSNSNWSSINKSRGANQIFEFALDKNFKFNTGINFTDRELSKQFDVPGYFNAFSSTLPNDLEKYPNGYLVVPSSSTTLPIGPMPSTVQHPSNTSSIQDVGGYFQAIADFEKFRFSAGIRQDKNSIYGSTVNPRVSSIYKFSKLQVFKLVYGEAFQEPTPAQLYGDSGGANYGQNLIGGSSANTYLKPEKIRSSEFIWIVQGNNYFSELSAYYSRYDRVIEMNFQSTFGKRIYGTEWKMNLYFKNPVQSSDKLSLFFNYTFTESLNSVVYNQDTLSFKNGSTAFGKYENVYDSIFYPDTQTALPRQKHYYHSGDIAKNKFNVGINIPLFGRFNINLRGNYIGQRGLYTTNPLRNQGITTDPYFLLNGAFTVNFESYGFLTLKVYNILNQYYLQPGVEYAGAGNIYWERSLDYRNSILPQPGRYYLLALTMTF